MMLRKTSVTNSPPIFLRVASMRPQHDAAENLAYTFSKTIPGVASMRPQHDAAENLRWSKGLWERLKGFNEAAA